MTAPYYADESVTIHAGDCLDVLATLPDASVDAVVTDPPYGLEFMGKEWDGADGFRRSLNPNDVGRDNAFGRTSKTSPEYRTASKAQASRRQEGGISQATGPSFLGGLNPKCLICDRWQRGSNPCQCETPEWTKERLIRLHSFQEWCESWSRDCLRVLKPGGHLLAFGGARTWHRLTCAIEDVGFEIRDNIADFYDPDPSGFYGPLAWVYGSGFPKSLNVEKAIDSRVEAQRADSPDTDIFNPSIQWQGWGTALKPGFEPIVVARKPLAGTVAANVLAYGTGALNIDACRVVTSDSLSGGAASKGSASHADGWDRPWKNDPEAVAAHAARVTENVVKAEALGRWPANIILDESQAVELDAMSGTLTSGANPTRRGSDKFRDAYGDFTGQAECDPARGADSGGASRFFYVAKADASERVRIDGVAHPTVKPLSVMRWLVRLVTPPGGVVLEPFAGSGTTVEACIIEGFRCIAIEREVDYLPLIEQRINRRRDPVAAVKASGDDGGLFDLLGEVTA